MLVWDDRVERELTPIEYGNPAWSPDGSEIALVRCNDIEDMGCAIFVVPAEGDPPRRVSRDGIFVQPVWSPDGRSIAYQRFSRDEISVVAADGTGIVWSTDGSDSDPNWSPDGRQLAFVRSERVVADRSRHDVYVIEADGTGARRITDGEASSTSPAWSHDGTQLDFVQWTDTGECPASTLFVSDPGRQQPAAPDDVPRVGRRPAWSPDGHEIAFARVQECWAEERRPFG